MSKRYTIANLRSDVEKYNAWIKEDDLSVGRYEIAPRNGYCAIDLVTRRPHKRGSLNVGCGTARECCDYMSDHYGELINKKERDRVARMEALLLEQGINPKTI